MSNIWFYKSLMIKLMPVVPFFSQQEKKEREKSADDKYNLPDGTEHIQNRGQKECGAELAHRKAHFKKDHVFYQ